MTESARLRLRRDRARLPVQTTWEFHTGATPLPLGLVADYVSGVGDIGRNAKFRGSAWFAPDENGAWSLDINGACTRVDLDQLVSNRFPHKLSGEALLELTDVRFRNGLLSHASGKISSGSGVVSRSLLLAATNSCQLQTSAEIERLDVPLFPFLRLAIGFDIRAEGVTLAGHCGEQSGILMQDLQQRPMLGGDAATVPTVALVRMLVPASETLVPASEETQLLLNLLPMPPIVPSSDSPVAPYTPVRLGEVESDASHLQR